MPFARVGVGRNKNERGDPSRIIYRRLFKDNLGTQESGNGVRAKQGKGAKTFSFQFRILVMI